MKKSIIYITFVQIVISVASNSSSVESLTMFKGWPDAIICGSGSSEGAIFLIQCNNCGFYGLSTYTHTTSKDHVYINFNFNGNFNETGGHETSSDGELSDGCKDKSIMQLFKEDRCIKFGKRSHNDSMIKNLPDAIRCGKNNLSGSIFFLDKGYNIRDNNSDAFYNQFYDKQERFVSVNWGTDNKVFTGNNDATGGCNSKSLNQLVSEGRTFKLVNKFTESSNRGSAVNNWPYAIDCGDGIDIRNASKYIYYAQNLNNTPGSLKLYKMVDKYKVTIFFNLDGTFHKISYPSKEFSILGCNLKDIKQLYQEGRAFDFVTSKVSGGLIAHPFSKTIKKSGIIDFTDSINNTSGSSQIKIVITSNPSKGILTVTGKQVDLETPYIIDSIVYTSNKFEYSNDHTDTFKYKAVDPYLPQNNIESNEETVTINATKSTINISNVGNKYYYNPTSNISNTKTNIPVKENKSPQTTNNFDSYPFDQIKENVSKLNVKEKIIQNFEWSEIFSILAFWAPSLLAFLTCFWKCVKNSNILIKLAVNFIKFNQILFPKSKSDSKDKEINSLKIELDKSVENETVLKRNILKNCIGIQNLIKSVGEKKILENDLNDQSKLKHEIFVELQMNEKPLWEINQEILNVENFLHKSLVSKNKLKSTIKEKDTEIDHLKKLLNEKLNREKNH